MSHSDEALQWRIQAAKNQLKNVIITDGEDCGVILQDPNSSELCDSLLEVWAILNGEREII